MVCSTYCASFMFSNSFEYVSHPRCCQATSKNPQYLVSTRNKLTMVLLVTILKTFLSVLLILVISKYGNMSHIIDAHEISAVKTSAVSNINETHLVPMLSSPIKLSRRKRFIAFPEGSSFSVVFKFQLFTFTEFTSFNQMKIRRSCVAGSVLYNNRHDW